MARWHERRYRESDVTGAARLGELYDTIAEEKRWNVRVAGRSREAFIEHMGSHHLPPPKRLAEAVTANRACGNVPIPVQG